MPWCVPDFETVSQCDLKKAGAYRYAEDPTTNILCLAVWFGEGDEILWYPGEPCPPRLLDAINDPGMFFVAHNADFEKAIWRHLLIPLGWPDIPNARWHDTAARAANVNLPRGLDKVLTALNGPLEKDMEGNKLTIGLSKVNAKTGMMPPITRVILERVGEYCLGDVRGQAWLAKRIGWLDPGERTTYLLDQEINERGLRLDMPLVRKMQRIVDNASGPLADEFKQLTGGLKMTQVAKVHGWLLSRGVVLPDMKKETLAAVLGQTDEGEYVDLDERLNIQLPQDVRRALRIRQLIGSSSIKKLGSMENCVSAADGRARGLLLYHGAGPGRWTGRLLQPQNFPRGSLGDAGQDIDALVAALMTGDHEYVAACYGPAVEVVVSSLRHVICADPGNALVAGDYAQIEARLVLAIAGQHDKTDLMASGADVYVDMALDIYDMTKFDVADKEKVKAFKIVHLEKRQVGKNTILGCGFQMGAPKFHDRYCPEQPMEFAEKVIKTYRNDWAPCVPKLWYGLQEAAIRAVWDGRAQEAYGVVYQLEDAWLTARLPSGRKLWYFSPKKTRRAMPWDADDVRPGFSYLVWKNGQRRVVDAYGGLLTENVVQGTARDLLRQSMVTCRKENLPMVLTVHDELVLEQRERDANPKLLQEIMEDIPAWAKALKVPVAAETWAGARYRK